MTSQRFSLILATLLALSTLACFTDSDDNNSTENNSSDNNADSNNDDKPVNRDGKVFELTPEQAESSGAFNVEITDGDDVYTTVIAPTFKLSAVCQTYGEDEMDGFTMGMLLSEGVGLVQIIVRKKALDTWSFTSIMNPIDSPDNQAHVNLRFQPNDKDPLFTFFSKDGEVTVTELPFEPATTDGFFHLKATATMNMDVLDQNGLLLRQATATWTVDMPFNESLEECFAN